MHNCTKYEMFLYIISDLKNFSAGPPPYWIPGSAPGWTCHEETLSCLLSDLTVVIETPQTLTEDSSPKTCSTATSLLNSIQNFPFLTTLVIVEHYLKYTKPLSKTLQSHDCDLIKALDDATNLVSFLQSRRGSETQFEELFDKVKAVAAQIGVEQQTPRLCGRQTHRSNVGDAAEPLTTY